MLAQLTAAFRQVGIHRALSVLLAVAFISFTFIHAMHHCGIAAESPVHVAVAALDGSSDGPDKAPVPEHCCNCSTAAMFAAESALPATAFAPSLEVVVWRALQPYVLPAEIRPPIA
jgi:hypothetical protein